MWASIPICLWPSVWLSSWLLGAATATAARLPAMLAPLAPQRLRTPLLRLHVSTQRLNPHAGLKKPYEMRALRLIPAKPDCEAN
jgi:hypothetical protein